MCSHRHIRVWPAGLQTERLAGDRHAVGDAIAFILVLLATAAILALAGLAIAGVLHAIAWVVGR
jgi:hypothetical protein